MNGGSCSRALSLDRQPTLGRMSRGRLWCIRLVLALSVAAPVLVDAVPARACSCGASSGLANAIREPGRAAFVGDVVRVASDGGLILYRFHVEEAVAGDLGTELVAESPVSGTACGVDLEIGERAAFVLGRRGETWIVSSCGQAAPDDMLHAASFLGFLQSWTAVPWYAATGVAAMLVALRAFRSRGRRRNPRA